MSSNQGPRESLIQYEEPIEINQNGDAGKSGAGTGGLKKKTVNLPP